MFHMLDFIDSTAVCILMHPKYISPIQLSLKDSEGYIQVLLNILTRISSSVVSKLISSFSSLSPFKCASFFSCLVYTLITYFFYYSGSHLNYPLDSQGISHKPGSLDLYWKHRILSPERVKSPLPTKMHICSCCVVLLVSQLHLIFATLWTIIPPGSSVHGINFPGENTGVGCHFLLQGIFSQNLQPST